MRRQLQSGRLFRRRRTGRRRRLGGRVRYDEYDERHGIGRHEERYGVGRHDERRRERRHGRGRNGRNGQHSLRVREPDRSHEPSERVHRDGMVHRPEKRQCPETIPRAGFSIDAGADCHRDADCTAKPHGHCEWWSSLIGSGTRCEYGCVNDAECGAGQICLCGAVTGTCTGTTDCTQDADCGGLMCVGYYEACEQTRFSCQSLDDTCGGFLDCQSSP